MSKSAKRERLPAEFARLGELIIAPVISGIEPILREITPDTHTAQFNKELSSSLVLTWEVKPPVNEIAIDVNDKFPLTVKVSNTYDVQAFTPFRVFRFVPRVWFKDVALRVLGTRYASVENRAPWDMYSLVTGSQRLKPGDTIVKEFTLKALAQVSGPIDPKERVADLTLYANLDLEEFFKYTKSQSVYTQIRQP